MTIDDDSKKSVFEIILVGDSNTGKTSLLSQLTNHALNLKNKKKKNNKKKSFHLGSQCTSGVYVKTHQIPVDDDMVITANIWDIGGGEEYRAIAKSLYQEAHAILLVYDISNYTSFENVTGRLKDIRDSVGPITVVKLVGNKNDLEYMRAVSTKEANEFATANGLSFIETSALKANPVKTVFHCLATEICTEMKKPIAEVINAVHQLAVSDTNDKKDLTCEDTQQQQKKPFHIVLVDIEAAEDKRIVCVEKPLDEKGLEFVALSYRWGELQEEQVDTKIGYVASLTSFSIFDFFSLCRMIRDEPDLKSIKYVWVDAICVDQTNRIKRKATIHQMSNIYDRAKYILAVPDLHLAYLKKETTDNYDVIERSYCNRRYIYHLIHGNTDELIRLDEEWLDQLGVPKDLRKPLARNPTLFLGHFLKCQPYGTPYDPKDAFDHIQKAVEDSHNQKPVGNCSHKDSGVEYTCEMPHHVLPKSDKDEPLDYNWWIKEMMHDGWKIHMTERRKTIRRSMEFLEDLIKSWSSRVWVISEYNIARKKNKMKYWFIQLQESDGGRFFEFDFGNASVSTTSEQNEENCIFKNASSFHTLTAKSDELRQSFLKTMARQLNEQTFFDMMLTSKASKNEDRLYAILPFTKYKDKIPLVHNINTMTSLKLKLFEWMDIMDKLELLHFIAQGAIESLILPTFVTPYFVWGIPKVKLLLEFSNYDLTDNTAVALIQPNPGKTIGMDSLYRLRVKPKDVFVRSINDYFLYYLYRTRNQLAFLDFFNCTTLWEVCIGNNCGSDFSMGDWITGKYIHLVGSMEGNKWVVARVHSFEAGEDRQCGFTHYPVDDDFDGFDIY